MPKGISLATVPSDAQKLSDSIGRKAEQVRRRQAKRAWSSYCGARLAFDEAKLSPNAANRPAPQVTLRQYARITAADPKREVIYKNGEWRLASRKDKLKDRISAGLKQKNKNTYNDSKEKFIEFMKKAVEENEKNHVVSEKIDSDRVNGMQLQLRYRPLNAERFASVFGNREIEPYLAVGKNEFSAGEVDKVMRKEYGSLLKDHGKDSRIKGTKYRNTKEILKYLKNRNMPDAGHYNEDTGEINVFRVFLSTDVIFHEFHHANSSDIRTAYGVAIDEGITEYLSHNLYCEALRLKYSEKYSNNIACIERKFREKFDWCLNGYKKEVNVIRELVAQLDNGENLIREAYFQGEPGMKKLRLAFDKKFGHGKFSEFMSIMHTKADDPDLSRKNYKAAMAVLRMEGLQKGD